MTEGYKFSSFWFEQCCYYWPRVFEYLEWNNQDPKIILEVGSFEGQSTCWILQNLVNHPDSRVYCLDTFEGGEEHQQRDLESLFERFMHNVSLTGKENLVEVLVGESRYSLCDLISNHLSCDFIYIDGSHRAQDVLADGVLAWMLLKVGGIMIFDDYVWSLKSRDILSIPKLAIDSFVNCHLQEIELLNTGHNHQVCLRRRPI